MTRLLAIDPGTHRTGFCLFIDGRPKSLWSWQGPPDLYNVRLSEFMDYYANTLEIQCPDEVACERPGIRQDKPVPQLQAMVKDMESVTKRAGLPWSAYAPNTVLASVRPRGVGMGWATKEIIAQGVVMLYGADLGDVRTYAQDMLDAVAIGHCHLSKQLVAAKEATH